VVRSGKVPAPVNSELLTRFNKLSHCRGSRIQKLYADTSFKQIIINISNCIRNNVIVVLENLIDSVEAPACTARFPQNPGENPRTSFPAEK